MKKAKIALVDILDDPDFETLELFAKACRKTGISGEIIARFDGFSELDLIKQTKPSGIIISGSRHNISDGITVWMLRLIEFILEMHEKIPILGVCFGHQIIAHAFGGEVIKHAMGREVGTVEIRLNSEASNDVLFSGLSDVIKIQMTHGDVVTSVPLGAILLAENDYCKVQAFRLSDTWGIQFHPELSLAVFKDLLYSRIKVFVEANDYENAENYKKILERLADCPDGYNVLGKFIKYCLERSG